MMNVEAIKDLYQKNGFLWNEQLEALQITYGGKDFTFYREGLPGERILRFDVSWCIELGRPGDVGMYDHIVFAIGEDCAPVAEEDPGSYGIMWLLTASGKLVGYHDFSIYRVDDVEESWSGAIAALLAGGKVIEAANVSDHFLFDLPPKLT